MNLAYRPIYACCDGNDVTVTYLEFWKIMSPALAQTSWSLFLRAIRPSIMAGTLFRLFRLFRISILVWERPEERILVNASQETQESTSDRGSNAQQIFFGFQLLEV